MRILTFSLLFMVLLSGSVFSEVKKVDSTKYRTRVGVENQHSNVTIKYYIYDNKYNFKYDKNPTKMGYLENDMGVGFEIVFGKNNEVKNKEYAIKLHQDINKNGKIDKEDLCGYSNNLPHWEGAKFNMETGKFETDIKIKMDKCF